MLMLNLINMCLCFFLHSIYLSALCVYLPVSRYGNAERVYRLEFVSNGDFTDSEFAKWKETVMLQGLSLPTAYEVEQKLKDIKVALEYKFNEQDVEMVCSFSMVLKYLYENDFFNILVVCFYALGGGRQPTNASIASTNSAVISMIKLKPSVNLLKGCLNHYLQRYWNLQSPIYFVFMAVNP